MKRVLITGVTSTLGIALLKKLNRDYYDIVGLSRDDSVCHEGCSAIVRCDLNKIESVEHSLKLISTKFDHLILMAATNIYDCEKCVEAKLFMDSALVNSLSQSAIAVHCAKLNPDIAITVVSSNVMDSHTPASFSYTHSKLLLETSLSYLCSKREMNSESLKILRFPYLGYAMKNTLKRPCKYCGYADENINLMLVESAVNEIIAQSFPEACADEY